MRISDWSSDVCSSDLVKAGPQATDVQRNLEAAGYEPGTDEFRQALREHMTKPLSRTDVRLPASHQETEEAKTVGEWYGTQFTTMQEAATAATSSNARLDRLGQLLENVATGKTAPTTQAIKAVAKSAGFDLEAFGITDDVGPAEAAAALSNQMALELQIGRAHV